MLGGFGAGFRYEFTLRSPSVCSTGTSTAALRWAFLPGNYLSREGFLGREGFDEAFLGKTVGGVSVESSAFGALAFGVRCCCGCHCACRLRYRRHAVGRRSPHATVVRAHGRGDRNPEHGERISDPGADLQGGGGARGLERGQERALCAASDLS